MFAWKTELEKAVINDDTAAVEKLLPRYRLGAALERLLHRSGSEETNSLLHLAAYSNSTNTARLLIGRGEDVNQANTVGNTPLHIAALYNSWETADLLISSGAKTYIANGSGETPLDVAEKHGNHKLAELLRLTEKQGAETRRHDGVIAMSKRTIYLTEYDVKRLQEVINDRSKLDHHEPEYVDSLIAEMSQARVVGSTEIPADVVTMNSTVRMVDVETGEEEEYTLVFPADADISESKISVLAPIGTAILGYKVGDTFTWKVPDGERQLRIEEILYQPEASGDFHL